MILSKIKLPAPAITICCMVCLVFAGDSPNVFSQASVSADELDLSVQEGPESRKDEPRPLMRIGVLARGSVADCAIRYKATADYLTDRIGDYRFAIVPIRSDDFLAAVGRGETDFTLSCPLFCSLLQAKGQISAIATMQGDFEGVRFSKLGGVLFCRSDRDDIKSVKDIPGRSFAAVSENSVSWIASADFLWSRGIQPKKDASDFAFLTTNANVVHAVTDGTYDFGAIDTGTLERMAKAGTITISDYRVFIDPGKSSNSFHDRKRRLYQPDFARFPAMEGPTTNATVNNADPPSPDFPFVASTPLYPQWAFARTNSVSDSLAGKVATTLYAMPEDARAAQRGRYAGWMIPANYLPMWECFQSLQGSPAQPGRVGTSGVGVWELFAIAVLFLILSGTCCIRTLKNNLRMSKSVINQQTENMMLKEKSISDLKRRIAVITGEEHDDMNVLRHDYRIEYLTSEWEEKYGPGVGQYCYQYFVDREEPCRHCSLREAFKKDRVCSIEKSFPREEGRPLRVTTIPLSGGNEGAKLFGQIYCDVLIQNRMTALSAFSQERETRYLLLQGMYRSRGETDPPAKTLQDLEPWFDEEAFDEKAPPRHVDINSLVQEVADMTEHLWDPVAELSLDLSFKCPIVWAADLDLRIVVANLILHAVSCLTSGEFSSERKGVITLSTQVKDDTAFLIVMDNGNAQRLMNLKELIAEPGRHENHREDFIKMGLWPIYSRVFEKWNGKLRVHRPDEHRMIRTATLPIVTNDLLIGAERGDSSISQWK